MSRESHLPWTKDVPHKSLIPSDAGSSRNEFNTTIPGPFLGYGGIHSEGTFVRVVPAPLLFFPWATVLLICPDGAFRWITIYAVTILGVRPYYKLVQRVEEIVWGFLMPNQAI
jgi:hypothetical protein